MKYLSKILLGLSAISLFIGIKVENYNSVFIITSLLTGGIGYYLITSISKKESTRTNKEFIDRRDELIKNGLKFKVDLSTCKVITNNYRQETINEQYSQMDKYKALDALSGRDTRDFSDVIQTVIVHEQKIGGERIKFYSNTFNKDEATIKFYLSNIQIAWLYVDPQNATNYYFNINL